MRAGLDAIPTAALAALIVGALTLAGTWLTVRQSRKQGAQSHDLDEFREVVAGYRGMVEGLQADVTRLRDDADADRTRIEDLECDNRARTAQLAHLDREIKGKDYTIREWTKWAAQVVALLRMRDITPPPLPAAFREDEP